MKRPRDIVRDRTGANRGGTGIEWVIENLNPILRGWGNCFRTGNADDKFGQVDDYAYRRLRKLLIRKRGRNLRAGQADQCTSDWFNEMGLYRSAEPPLSRKLRNHVKKTIGKPCAGNRTHGLKGGWGNRPATALRP
jgi:hypothetical protein